MDVSRGDRPEFKAGDRVRDRFAKVPEAMVVGPDPKAPTAKVVVLLGDQYIAVQTDTLELVPPDVVTLTLSYRGHEVSEEVSLDDTRYYAEMIDRWSGPSRDVHNTLSRAARALAEKVDADA